MGEKKTLFLIHGRDFKPEKSDLEKLWIDALKFGIVRDHGTEGSKRFSQVDVRLIYYGDLSNDFLAKKNKKQVDDLNDRHNTLCKLKKHARIDFSEEKYMKMRSPFHGVIRWLVGVAAAVPVLRDIGMWGKMPEMSHYWWNSKKQFGKEVRKRLSIPLHGALEAGKDVMVIGHSLGSIVAYDVLSMLSCSGPASSGKVSRLVTLGSPLGVSYVQHRLRNWKKFPNNVSAWVNITAKDDFVALDEEVKNDFRGMSPKIKDCAIFNLAVRKGKTHQHHSIGYLIHPVVAHIVDGWTKS